MKRVAFPLLVSGAIAFACGDGHEAFDGAGPGFDSDGGADAPQSCVSAVRCSRDLHAVVEGCDESRVLSTCAAEEGCVDGQCRPACEVGGSASIGCEFVPLPPPREEKYTVGSCFTALLANTWELPTRIEVEYEGRPVDVAASTRIVRTHGAETTLDPFDGELKPGELAVVFLSEQATASQSVACPDGVKAAVLRDTSVKGTNRGSTFRIKTSAPVSAYSIYPYNGALTSASTTATLLLPIASWKADYLTTDPWEIRYYGTSEIYYPTTQIVAAQDDTKLTVIGSAHIAGGNGVDGAEKGVAKTYHLARGELLQFSEDLELTGTRIGADKPVGVWLGHQGMIVPSNASCCGDTSLMAASPLQSWGHEYVVVPYRSRSDKEVPEDYIFRITGAVDGTDLTYEPARPKDAPASTSPGSSIRFMTQEPFVVKSQGVDHPFAVYSYMSGNSFAHALGWMGDPEFVAVIPTEQFLGRYVFYVDTSFRNSQLVIVRARNDGKDFEPVELDCAGALGDWSPVGTSGKYETTRLWIVKGGKPQAIGAGTCSNGRRELKSRGAVGVTVWGMDQYSSYGYPGGAALRTLNHLQTPVN